MAKKTQQVSDDTVRTPRVEAAKAMVRRVPKSPIRAEDLLSTGSTLLDLACSGRLRGGFKKGHYYWIVGDSQSGKAQPLDAKILTPTGWKFMGELVVGMTVIDPDGGFAKVAGVFPQGKKEVFRVIFSDGASTECCGEHLWRVRRVGPGGNTRDAVMMLQDIRQELARPGLTAKHFIPLTKPVRFKRQGTPLPLHPYLLGVLIGDGHLGNVETKAYQIKISCGDQEILDAVKEVLPVPCHLVHRDGVDYDLNAGGRGCPLGNPVRQALEKLNLFGKRSHEKFIPREYLQASVEDRLLLLQGLMDTDGWSSPSSAEFCTVSKKLSDDFTELVRSLGGRAMVREEHDRTYVYRGERRQAKDSYTTGVVLPKSVQAFALTRKVEVFNKRNRTEPLRRIARIESVGIKECQCISVTSKRSLYVTDDFIVTHNTFLSLTCLAEAARNPEFDDYRFIYDNGEDGALMDIEFFFGKAVFERLEPPQVNKDGYPIYSETVEEFYYNLKRAYDAKKPFIYIQDSFDVLSSEGEQDKFKATMDAYDKGKEITGSMGDGKAKKNSSGIRQLIVWLRERQSIFIGVSQTRDNVGGYGSPKSVSGGHALRFYATQAIWSSIKGKIKKTVRGKELEIGKYIELEVKKNRLNGKDRKVIVPIHDTVGFDDIGSLVDYLLEWKHWKKNDKGIFDAPEFDIEGTNRETFIKVIEADNEERELKSLVKQVWEEIETACAVDRKPRYQ